MESLNLNDVFAFITCAALIFSIFILICGIKDLKKIRKETQRISEELKNV